ncbi:MAG: ATP-binding cassette domain-containing protein, partial [Holosporales bacterium]|nr:ATP-binding cassette domain-containing protein [Holosporales bacterium]
MPSYQYIYVMKGLTKILPGGRELFKDIWLSFLPGTKIGIVGVNGSGKSTLMKVMAGLDTEFQGEAWAADGVACGYLPQEPTLDPSLTVRENVLSGLSHIKTLLDQFESLSARFSEPLSEEEMTQLIEEQGLLQEKIEALEGWDIERKIQIAMDALRCPPGDMTVTQLSGGERRRVALCRLLLQHPDLLLLDEPTNHLDAESVAWLERFLKEYTGTVILVTHDRYFLDNIAEWILELDRGQGIPFEGNYSGWLEQKQKRLEQEGKQEAGRQRVLSRELEWIRASPKARQSKSKARITAYEALLSENGRAQQDTAQITIPPGPRLGDTVLTVDGLSKSFGDKVLI